MSDKDLSGEEKRQLMKDEFKKDLQDRRKFLDRVKALRQQTRISKALKDMSPEDDTNDWISKLDEETAFLDAKTEIALETAEDAKQQADLKHSEEELKKLIAEGIVEEIKKEMMEEEKVEGLMDISKNSKEESENKSEKDTGGVRKTLGDMEL